MIEGQTHASVFDSCTDSCGWIAAFYALLSYGTYGVPIKETVKIHVHPLVFQSYKTIVMFILAPFVLCMGIELRYTPLGLISGLLWVLGGTAGVVAVRYAGMALAVGVWASVMIFVNFVWGILIFHEPVANLTSTTAAFGLLTLGLIGMSKYGTAESSSSTKNGNSNNNTNENEDEDQQFLDESQQRLLQQQHDQESIITKKERGVIESPKKKSSSLDKSASSSPCIVLRRIKSEGTISLEIQPDVDDRSLVDRDTHALIFGMLLPKQSIGIAAAVFNGLMAGSSLIPLHYAKQYGFGGAHYMISYATGAFISNIILWIIYYFVLLYKLHYNTLGDDITWETKFLQAADNMPDWHIHKLWKPGFCAGFLLATAMFGSIISVTYLGQGIGNSVIQAKIIISGMWGIFYYKEIQNRNTIRKWFLSATLSVAGIVWLSRERLAATSHTGSNGNSRMLLEIEDPFYY